MDQQLASVIWDELKRYINTVDRPDAAENFVSILIDNDFDPEDIKTEFKGDSDIKRAIASYLDNDQEEYEEEDSYDEDNEDNSDWE